MIDAELNRLIEEGQYWRGEPDSASGNTAKRCELLGKMTDALIKALAQRDAAKEVLRQESQMRKAAERDRDEAREERDVAEENS